MKTVARAIVPVLLCSLLLISSCKTDFKPAEVNSGFAVFSYPLYLGSDFMSGFTDGALSNAGQRNSIPYLFNQQLNKNGIKTVYNQHFVAMNNGYGLNFPATQPKFYTSFHLGYKTDCMNINSLFPLHDSININDVSLNNELIYYQTGAYYSVMGIPYAKIADYTDSSMGIPGGKSPYYPQLASFQSQSYILGDALAQPFTFFLLWAGMEDVFNYALRGGEIDSITDFNTFDTQFDIVLDNLLSSSQGAHGVVANIPDLDVFPFFTTVPWNGMVLTDSQANALKVSPFGFLGYEVGPNGFIIYDPTVTPIPYRKMTADEYVLLTVNTDSLKCNNVGVLDSIPPHYVLDHFEVVKINAAIAHFNAKIKAAATAHNIPVVDMNSFFRKVKNGYYYNGIFFSSEFIKGAFFSLDGYHPTAQGYGLLTNEFIKTINSFYHSNIPLVDVTRLPGIIFP